MLNVGIATNLKANAPSYYLRYKSLFDRLANSGEIVYGDMLKILFGKYVRIVPQRKTDLIFVQRLTCGRHIKKLFDTEANSSLPFIYETDDLLLLDRKKDRPVENYHEIAGYLTKAAGIITSTNYLADELRRFNSNVFVFPNLLDPEIWDTNAREKLINDGRIRICCMGTNLMPQNMSLIIPAIYHCLRVYKKDIIFYLWGNHKYVDSAVRGLPNVKMIERRLSYKDYAKQLQMCAFDMAIVPLRDSHFGRAKSNIKYLEYGISRVPALFSRVVPYEMLPHKESCMLVDNHPESWIEGITEFVEKSELRQSFADKALNDVRNNYMLNAKFIDEYLSMIRRFAGDKRLPRPLIC